MNYKIIASDLDGTLFNSNTEVSRENRIAIERLSRHGVNFVIATGRALSEIPDSLLKNSSIRYIISSNGASVYDSVAKKKIIDFSMKDDDLQSLISTLFSYDVHLTVRSDGIGYVEAKKQSAHAFEHYCVHPNHAKVTLDYSVKRTDFHSYVKSLTSVEVASAYFYDADAREKCARELEAFGLRAAWVKPIGLEIFGKEAGKGAALSALANHLGVSMDECIGVGDSENDLTLLQSAGLSLATSNASDSLKRAADSVICSNDEHIAEYILKNYVK